MADGFTEDEVPFMLRQAQHERLALSALTCPVRPERSVSEVEGCTVMENTTPTALKQESGHEQKNL
jgi:hypothetical protein